MSFDLKIKNGDLQLQNGDLQQIVDSEKLIQDILKICLTDVGANPFQPWYGSFLSKAIIGTTTDGTMLVQVAKSQLNNALNNLKSLQNIQVKSAQQVSADEQIASILSVSVSQNKIDPRLYQVDVRVITKGNKPISTAFTISTI